MDKNDPCSELAETVQRLEALIGQEHISEDYVHFRIDLLKAQLEVCRALATTPTPSVNSASRKPNDPALCASDVSFDRCLLATLFAGLRDAVEQRGRQSAETRRLADAAETEPELLEELAGKAAFGPDQPYLESLARRLEVSVDALLFFGRALAAPFVGAAAETVTEVPTGTADASGLPGHCPICGSPPAMATLSRDEGSEGSRTLHCSLCGQSWPFRRLECPFCRNSDHDSLAFLRIPEVEARWVETCEKCKRYVKTVDERKLPAGEKIIPLVEDTATLHFDLLAEREGYLRRLPYAAAR